MKIKMELKGKRTAIGIVLMCACGYLIAVTSGLYVFRIIPENVYSGIIGGLSGIALIALGLISYGIYTRFCHAFYGDEEGNPGKGDIRQPRIEPGSFDS